MMQDAVSNPFKSFEKLVESGVDVGAGAYDYEANKVAAEAQRQAMLARRRRRMSPKQKKALAQRENAKRKVAEEKAKKEAEILELLKDIDSGYWYDVGKITQTIPSPTHRRQLYIFYKYGYAGEDVYPKEVFEKNLWDLSKGEMEKRKTMSKLVQVNVISTYKFGGKLKI